MRKWRIEDSAELYNINGWGLKYFSINDKGHVAVTPREGSASVDLKELMDELQVRDVTSPVLLRFPDILDNRIEKISKCFQQAADEYGYTAKNFIIYPIKVNQMRQVVEEIVSHGKKFNIGLEAGSKPELHAVLAINTDENSLIICNGYKDENYVELALLAQKMGRRIFLVVEKLNELRLIADISKRLKIRPNIGIRISIEGLSCKNDELRGHAGGFDKGLRTLLTLKGMGVKDIGFGCTVSNNNSKDMLSLYQLSKSLGMEFATAAFHNSYYFHKGDNVITNKDEVCKNFGQLIEWQLKEKHPKSWFRAFFNMGLINYIEGGRRMLPCEAGSANFFIEPYGDIYPCNGLEEKYWMKKMGNIRETPAFMDIWNSKQAQDVRKMVRKCPKNCWMVGTASPVMHKYIKYPLKWAVVNKIRSMQGKSICLDKCWYNVGQDSCQGDLREEF